MQISVTTPILCSALYGVSVVSAQITCLKVGSEATASWTNGKGQDCTWRGVVGSNFGINPANSGK